MRHAPGRVLAFAMLLTIAVLFLSAFPPPALAGSEPPSPLATAYNTQRKVARSPAGMVYAAIASNVSGSPRVGVVSTTDGISWMALPGPSTTGNASDRASLAIDSRGRLHLVWTETSAYNRQVFYARFEGGQWTSAEQLSHSVGYAGFPSLAVDSQDRVQVVWYAFDGTFYQIYYRRLDVSTWTPERALTTETVDATSPAIALGPDGKVHVVWFRLESRGTFNEVAYLRLEGDTVVETHAISGHGVDSIDPSIVVDRRGTVHVVWSAVVGGLERIEHLEGGSNWSAIEAVSPATVGATHPTLALDQGSRLHLVWEGTDHQIYAQSKNGSWSTPVTISSGGVNRYPSARWSQDHNPFCEANAKVDVVWTQELGGVVRLQYGAIDAPSPCPRPSTGLGPVLWVAGALLVGVGAVLAVTALRARRTGGRGRTLNGCRDRGLTPESSRPSPHAGPDRLSGPDSLRGVSKLFSSCPSLPRFSS